jgi:hypothetical protein
MNEFACPFGEDDQLTSTLVSNVFRRIPDPVSFCLLAMLSLTGCAATTNPSSFAHGTKVGYDPYLRTTSIVGPNISLFPVNYFLDRINGQDYITGWYEASEWAFLHAAFDIDGNQLAFEKLGSKVGYGGTVQENFSIHLPYSYLRDHSLKPIRIRVFGENNSVDISMNPMYVQGFLSKAGSQ